VWLTFAAPGAAFGQVREWNAAPGCPAPHDLSLVTVNRSGTTEPRDKTDDVAVRVTVTAQLDGWRAILEATDHAGKPLGERVLEHTTCEELNRVVLVSLSVLLGTDSPIPAQEESLSPPTPAQATPSSPTAPALEPAIPSPATAASAPPSIINPKPTQTPVTEAPLRAERLVGWEKNTEVSPEIRRMSSPTVDLLPGLVGALDSTVATSVGGEVSTLLNLREWGARLTGNWRTTVGAVLEAPEVRFSVASMSFAGCRYLSASHDWLLCFGPLLERLNGTVPAASRPEASAWLAGAKFGLTTLQRRETHVMGWFLDLHVHLRQGAVFQVGSPPSSIFEYPSVGALLTFGPDIRL
jgi:hypothetical protein